MPPSSAPCTDILVTPDLTTLHAVRESIHNAPRGSPDKYKHKHTDSFHPWVRDEHGQAFCAPLSPTSAVLSHQKRLCYCTANPLFTTGPHCWPAKCKPNAKKPHFHFQENKKRKKVEGSRDFLELSKHWVSLQGHQ